MWPHTLQNTVVNKLARRVANLAVRLDRSGFVARRGQEIFSTSAQTDLETHPGSCTIFWCFADRASQYIYLSI